MDLSCDNETILKKFLIDAKKYYTTEVLLKKKENNKVTVYIWEDYWDVLHKHPERNLDTLYFKKDLKESLSAKIKKFLEPETEDLYRSFGIPYKLNILLEGHPGTGKTSLIFAIASLLKLNIAILNFGLEMNDTVMMRALRDCLKIPY